MPAPAGILNPRLLALDFHFRGNDARTMDSSTADLVKATYLEILDDVHGFLDQLRTEMEDAIHKGERIQIR